MHYLSPFVALTLLAVPTAHAIMSVSEGEPAPVFTSARYKIAPAQLKNEYSVEATTSDGSPIQLVLTQDPRCLTSFLNRDVKEVTIDLATFIVSDKISPSLTNWDRSLVTVKTSDHEYTVACGKVAQVHSSKNAPVRAYLEVLWLFEGNTFEDLLDPSALSTEWKCAEIKPDGVRTKNEMGEPIQLVRKSSHVQINTRPWIDHQRTAGNLTYLSRDSMRTPMKAYVELKTGYRSQLRFSRDGKDLIIKTEQFETNVAGADVRIGAATYLYCRGQN